MPTLSSTVQVKSEVMPPNTQRADEQIEEVVSNLIDWKIGSNEEEESMEKKKTSLFDLEDDVFRRILGYLDVPSRLKLRVNRKIESRLLDHPIQLESIALTISPTGYALTTTTHRLLATKITPYSAHNYWGVWHLVQGLRRWSENTYIKKIEIDVQAQPNNNIGEAIKALFLFSADQLIVHTKPPSRSANYQPPRPLIMAKIPQITFANLLGMSQYITEICINHECNTIEAMDLVTLRRTMIAEDCSLKSLSMIVSNEVCKPFLKTCFEVTVDDGICRKTIRGAVSHVKLYSKHPTIMHELVHFNSNLNQSKSDIMTTVERNRIRISRINRHGKSHILKTLHSVHVHPMKETNLFYYKPSIASIPSHLII